MRKPEFLFPALGKVYMMCIIAVALIDSTPLWVAYSVVGAALIAAMILHIVWTAVRAWRAKDGRNA